MSAFWSWTLVIALSMITGSLVTWLLSWLYFKYIILKKALTDHESLKFGDNKDESRQPASQV